MLLNYNLLAILDVDALAMLRFHLTVKTVKSAWLEGIGGFYLRNAVVVWPTILILACDCCRYGYPSLSLR